MAESNNGAAQGAAAAQLSVQKIYVKDASFEVPSAPAIFQEQGQPPHRHVLPFRAAVVLAVQRARAPHHVAVHRHRAQAVDAQRVELAVLRVAHRQRQA